MLEARSTCKQLSTVKNLNETLAISYAYDFIELPLILHCFADFFQCSKLGTGCSKLGDFYHLIFFEAFKLLKKAIAYFDRG